jgi:hypothetical protein
MIEKEQMLLEQFKHARQVLEDSPYNDLVKCNVMGAPPITTSRFKEIAKSVFPEDEFTYEWPDFFSTFVPIVVFKKRRTRTVALARDGQWEDQK